MLFRSNALEADRVGLPEDARVFRARAAAYQEPISYTHLDVYKRQVRAYDDVHSSRSEPFQRGADVRRAAEAAEHFNTYGVFACLLYTSLPGLHGALLERGYRLREVRWLPAWSTREQGADCLLYTSRCV